MVISPEVISHPYPLAPKSKSTKYARPTESRFRSHPINSHSANSQGPYRQLESPSHSQSHAKTVSESTASTAPRLALGLGTPSDGPAIDGLGLGLGDWNLRAPDRAYVLAERHSPIEQGTVGSQSGRGRKLKKMRMVEGDWELVRTDHLDLEGRSKRISGIEGEKQESEEQARIRTADVAVS